MAKPYAQEKIPVLVVAKGDALARELEARLGKETSTRWNRFRVETTTNLESTSFDQTGPPKYAAIFYERLPGVAMQQQTRAIAKIDPLLPQIVVLERSAARPDLVEGRMRENGISEIVRDRTVGLEEVLTRRFRTTQAIENGVVVKVGGSAFDYEDDMDDPALGYVCDALRLQEQRILCTVGAGRRGDIAKRLRGKYQGKKGVQAAFPQAMLDALVSNLKFIESLVGTSALLRKPSQFYEIKNRKEIQLVATAPHYMMVRDQIPLQDSDTHTIALAEAYGIRRVVLIKRTDGIYNHDPYRGMNLQRQRSQAVERAWERAQQGNSRYEEVTVQQMLEGKLFSREGSDPRGRADQTTGHLMEDSALAYFAACSTVEEIMIIHVAPQEMWRKVNGLYRHVATQETLPLETNWQQQRMQAITNACNGISYSKIVRR